MSFETWHTYGYGVCTTEIKVDIGLSKILELLSLAPNLSARIKADLGVKNLENVCASDILYKWVRKFSETGYGDLAEILREVIKEAEKVELSICKDFSANVYLLYQPTYPWLMTDTDENITEEKLNTIYGKYISIITEEFLEVDYLSVEDGG